MKFLKGLTIFSATFACVLALGSCGEKDESGFKDKGSEVESAEFITAYEAAIEDLKENKGDYVLTMDTYMQEKTSKTEFDAATEYNADGVEKYEYDADNKILKYTIDGKEYGYEGDSEMEELFDDEYIYQVMADDTLGVSVNIEVDTVNKTYSPSYASPEEKAADEVSNLFEDVLGPTSETEMDYKFYVNGGVFTITIDQTRNNVTMKGTMQVQVYENSVIVIMDSIYSFEGGTQKTERNCNLEFKSVALTQVDLTDYTPSLEW